MTNSLKKHLLFIILLSVVAYFAGVFIVNENETAVEINNGKVITTYQAGTHWKTPFLNNLIMVYLSERNTTLDYQFKLKNNQSDLTASIAYNWHVINPEKYVLVNDAIDIINQTILSNYQRNTTIADFSSALNNSNKELQIESLGVVVDNVYIVSLAKKNHVVSSNSIQSLPTPQDYIEAMKIKNQAESDYTEAQQKMQQSNPKFYKLYNYMQSIQSKESIESLSVILSKIN